MKHMTQAMIGLSFVFLSSSALLPKAVPGESVENDRAGVQAVEEPSRKALPPLGKDWIKLGKADECWVNRKKHQVAVDGVVSLTKGYLEMFACRVNTKEHESVVALKSQAHVIHTGLLLVGAKNGSPAVFRPTYKPASGTTVGVVVEWVGDDDKPHRTKAQNWVRDLKTEKPMQHDWVFAGSGFWDDPDTGKSFYRAEGGDLICVSNFPTAMLDIPIESSQSNDALGFEALTENIPPRFTPVRVYLVPELEDDTPRTQGAPAVRKGTSSK
jgi:hypothetical protein